VRGELKKMNTVELNNVNYSLHIIRVIKLRRMRFAGYPVHMGGTRNESKILVENTGEKNRFGRHR
jgi:hypothetical protein